MKKPRLWFLLFKAFGWASYGISWSLSPFLGGAKSEDYERITCVFKKNNIKFAIEIP